MRFVIARYPFDLTKSEVQEAMKGRKPEPVTGESVTIGRRAFPVKQVGEIITRQDRRDFSAAEVVRALTKLGFTCHPAAGAVPAPADRRSVLEEASVLLGGTPQADPPGEGER
ncbi:SCO5918 family protein [Streptomyces sp. NPDC060194]|uniref:SCO5918 family protein n=1 Tax=Streptomyces sp. NPDC060194 TaxID=3347069 RepID=UPI00364E6220